MRSVRSTPGSTGFSGISASTTWPAPDDWPSYRSWTPLTSDSALGPEAQAVRSEERRRVWAALRQLSASDREILVLREFQDLSYAEIASMLDVPRGTVMSRLHTARLRLRARLQASAEGD